LNHDPRSYPSRGESFDGIADHVGDLSKGSCAIFRGEAVEDTPLPVFTTAPPTKRASGLDVNSRVRPEGFQY